jgi:hypothetical protein
MDTKGYLYVPLYMDTILSHGKMKKEVVEVDDSDDASSYHRSM